MQPITEVTQSPPKEYGAVPAELEKRDEVQRFVQYIREMKIDPADYTANKWREIIAKPDTLVGFGKPGDWYQYVLQQRSMLSFYEGLDESSSKFSQHVELLNIVKSKRGLNPRQYDWFNVVEMFEIYPPKFNVKETQLTFKIDINNDEYITLQANSCHWDRYSSEGEHVGQCGKIDVSVVQSTSEKLQRWIHVTYGEETLDVPVELSSNFFLAVSSLLKDSPKETIVKFVFDTCHYPYTKCDWTNEIEVKEVKKTDAGHVEDKYQHIKAEMNDKIPNAMQIFQKGYTNVSDHINLLDYLLLTIASRARTLHCRKMMKLSLTEDRCYDYSAAASLIANTSWASVSITSACFCTNIFNSNGEYEFAMQVEITKEIDYSSGDLDVQIKITLFVEEGEEIKQKFREIFQPYRESFSDCPKGECYINLWEEDAEEDISFQVKFFICHYAEHSIDERSILTEIIEVLRLNWSVNQFWKFLIDMSCMDEATTWAELDGWMPQFWESFVDGEQEAKFCGHSDTYSEYFSGESADDGEDTLMALEQELNDIKMAVNNSISITTVSEAMSLDG